jgi:hypothetical protein
MKSGGNLTDKIMASTIPDQEEDLGPELPEIPFTLEPCSTPRDMVEYENIMSF